MGIPAFNVDMDIISKLRDYPGADDGLTPDAFRAKFDLGGKLIQEYINTILLPNINMTTDVDALVNGVQDKLSMVFNISQAAFFEKVIQSGDFALNTGYKFNATKLSDTLFYLYGGDAVMQGHIASLETDEPISVAVAAGTYGTFRNDLVCLRFQRDANNVESVSLVYLQGTTNQSGGVDPSYRLDNINVAAAVTRDFPLYRIKVVDTTATAEALFTPFDNIADKITESAADAAAEKAADMVIEKLSVWEGGKY